MTDSIAREMRSLLSRLDSINGTIGRDDRVDIMRRLLGSEPESSTMLRLSAHAYVYARELRAQEERAEQMARGQLEFET